MSSYAPRSMDSSTITILIPKPDSQNYILPLLLLLLVHVVIYFSVRWWIHNQLLLCLLLWNWKRIMEILTQALEELWPSIEMMMPVHMEVYIHEPIPCSMIMTSTLLWSFMLISEIALSHLEENRCHRLMKRQMAPVNLLE